MNNWPMKKCRQLVAKVITVMCTLLDYCSQRWQVMCKHAHIHDAAVCGL